MLEGPRKAWCGWSVVQKPELSGQLGMASYTRVSVLLTVSNRGIRQSECL